MVTIIFEMHSTSLDNEKHLASGWNDVELSELGNCAKFNQFRINSFHSLLNIQISIINM